MGRIPVFASGRSRLKPKALECVSMMEQDIVNRLVIDDFSAARATGRLCLAPSKLRPCCPSGASTFLSRFFLPHPNHTKVIV
jgi:hypothetical protein